MSTAKEIVDRAIKRSISHTEIVHLPEQKFSVYKELSRRSMGSVETGRVFEFWGGKGSKEWRVHVRTK